MQAQTAINATAARSGEELAARLAGIAREFPRAAFASSLGAEDMVLTDAIWAAGLPIVIFTLDTGRLPRETLELIERAQKQYGREIEMHRPDAGEVERYVFGHGLNAFYESVELRKSCCHIRKVVPL